MRRYHKLPPCHTHRHSSKVDTPLAKTGPINDVGDASVIRYLRKEIKCCTAAGREEWEYVRGAALQAPR